MSRGAYGLASASLAGLVLGAVVPAMEPVGRIALAGLFVQTLVAVGGLSEPTADVAPGWAWRMLVVHHLVTSLPLVLLGLALGLETWLGAGTFLLGAVPPAVALPGYAAALGRRVRPLIRFCVLGYAAGLVLTPALVVPLLGADGRTGSMLVVLLFGLVLPGVLGGLAGPRLRRVPRRISLGVISLSALVIMIGMGGHLRGAIVAAHDEPWLLVAAAAVALGRCLVGGGLAWWYGPRDQGHPLRLEAALAGGGKNSVLAAVLAQDAIGGAAALPALLGLVAEVAVLGAAGFVLARSVPRRRTAVMVRP